MTTTQHTTRAVGLAVLLALSVVGGAVGFVGVVAADEHGNAELPQESITEHRGDVVPIDVALNDTTTAYVSMTYEGEYGVLVEVVDGDEDGHVGLEVNTHYARTNDVTAGVGLTAESEAAGDEYSVVSVTGPDEGTAEPLPTGSYDVAVGTELDGDALAEEQDTMEVTLEAGSLDGMRIWTAPYGPLAFDTREEFFERVGADGLGPLVTETTHVAKGDYVVVQVDVSGVYGQVTYRHDLTGVDEFGDPSGIRLRIEEANPSATSDEVRRVDLTDRRNVLVTDPANDTMFLVVNTDDDTFEPDTVYRATFELDERNALLPAGEMDETNREEVAATFAIVDPRATLETSGTLSRTADTTLRGTTNVAPGNELTVTLNGTGTDVFPLSESAVVNEDGTFSATFDLSDVSIGTNVTASVLRDDETVGETSVAVVQQVDDDEAEQTADGPDESTAESTPSESTAEPTPTPEPTPEPTVTDESPAGDGGDGDVSTTASPGFGVVVAALALLGAGLLATRTWR